MKFRFSPILSHMALALFLPFFVVFLNWELVEDRFVSPVENLDSEIQAWDWHDSTLKLSSTRGNHSQELQFVLPKESSSCFVSKIAPAFFPRPSSEKTPILFQDFAFFFNLPPPTLA